MGNNTAGDDYKFRGRGILQVTGRDNYKTVSTEYNKINPNNKKDFEVTPELLETDLECAVLSACIWWKTKPMNAHTTGITKEDVYKVSGRVNGKRSQSNPFMSNHSSEANHLKERWHAFEKISKKLGLIS